MGQNVIVGSRYLTPANPSCQSRSVLDDEGIRRHMVHAGGDHGVHRIQQVPVGLPGVP